MYLPPALNNLCYFSAMAPQDNCLSCYSGRQVTDKAWVSATISIDMRDMTTARFSAKK